MSPRIHTQPCSFPHNSSKEIPLYMAYTHCRLFRCTLSSAALVSGTLAARIGRLYRLGHTHTEEGRVTWLVEGQGYQGYAVLTRNLVRESSPACLNA